jgi:hypothetical protein
VFVVAVNVHERLDGMLKVFDKAEPNGACAKSSTAPTNLFRVNKDCKKLSSDEAVEFHNVVAKTLHVTKQARLDTCAPIAFLMTRVREPDNHDWKNMVHLMRHVRGTRDVPLVLSANGSHILSGGSMHDLSRCILTCVGMLAVVCPWEEGFLLSAQQSTS